jgi:hypothetical protein
MTPTPAPAPTTADIINLVRSLPTREQRQKFNEALRYAIGNVILRYMNTDNMRAN